MTRSSLETPWRDANRSILSIDAPAHGAPAAAARAPRRIRGTIIPRLVSLKWLVLVALLARPLYAQEMASTPPQLYRHGRTAQLSGDYYTAIEDYKSALEMNPAYLQPLVGMAESYFGLGEYSEALRYVREAERYDDTSVALLNLEGRAQIGVGDFGAARTLFDRVLARQPNNLDAEFGLAELDLAAGEPKTALAKFEGALRTAPENRRALLSLIVLYDSLGEHARAERYARIVLDAYPDDAYTHYVVARHYLESGNYTLAKQQVQTALALSPGNRDSTELLSEVYLRTGDYAKVVPLIEGILAKNRADYLLWYTLGLAEQKMGEYQDSVRNYAQAFTIHPDDEISRIAMESELIRDFKMKDPLRARYAQYHFDQGRIYEARDYLDRALREYRRGLLLDPYSREGRLLYAGVFKLEGFPAKYLAELEVLKADNQANTDVRDEIDVTSNALSNSVASAWGISQFDLQRERYAISLFYSTSDPMIHYLGQAALADYLRDLFESYENIHVTGSPVLANDFATAFRTARESGSDYFLTMSPTETRTYFQVDCTLYVSATGSKVRSFSVYRTGTGRVADALAAIASAIHSVLPLEGRILKRQFDQGVIDLGAMDGVKSGDTLLIVRNGSLQTAKDRLGFSYPASAVVGSFKVTQTDALISQGDIVKNQFFDFINVGDYVIYPPPANEKPVVQAAPPSTLYQRLLRIPGD